jgi:hypothetical protein
MWASWRCWMMLKNVWILTHANHLRDRLRSCELDSKISILRKLTNLWSTARFKWAQRNHWGWGCFQYPMKQFTEWHEAFLSISYCTTQVYMVECIQKICLFIYLIICVLDFQRRAAMKFQSTAASLCQTLRARVKLTLMELPEDLEVFPRAMHNQIYNWNIWMPHLSRLWLSLYEKVSSAQENSAYRRRDIKG